MPNVKNKNFMVARGVFQEKFQKAEGTQRSIFRGGKSELDHRVLDTPQRMILAKHPCLCHSAVQGYFSVRRVFVIIIQPA